LKIQIRIQIGNYSSTFRRIVKSSSLEKVIQIKQLLTSRHGATLKSITSCQYERRDIPLGINFQLDLCDNQNPKRIFWSFIFDFSLRPEFFEM